MKGNEGPKGQNERKWKPKRQKWKKMKAQKAKIKGNEGPKGQNERKWKPKRPKWKEMKAQKAKMTIFGGNFLVESAYLKLPSWRGSGGKSGPGAFWKHKERKWRPKRPKWKEMKTQKAKMKGNEGPKCQNKKKWRPKKPKSKEKGQNERKWKPKRQKWKEMKAQKAKMEGNEGPKGQNGRKWRPKRPKWKEMKAQKAKMTIFGGNFLAESAYLKLPFWKGSKANLGHRLFENTRKGNKGPKGQNERKWKPKRRKWKEMKAQNPK